MIDDDWSFSRYPLVPGHEVVGTIARVGSEVSGYHEGQRVFCAPNTGCGHCKQCISGNNNLCANYDAIGVTSDGGFAGYVRIPANSVRQGNVIPISESVDPAVAALVEPFACVVRGQNALHMHTGEVVLIMGAGPIGIMHMKLAKASGAGRVIISDFDENGDGYLEQLELAVDRRFRRVTAYRRARGQRLVLSCEK